MEFDKLLEESLSSDEETLLRIEPRNKRKYTLCNSTDDIKSLEKYGLNKGNFKYDEDQKFDKIESALHGAENSFDDKSNMDFMNKQIVPVIKEITQYMLSKKSANPKVHLLAKV